MEEKNLYTYDELLKKYIDLQTEHIQVMNKALRVANAYSVLQAKYDLLKDKG